jgi:hypothetical protein
VGAEDSTSTSTSSRAVKQDGVRRFSSRQTAAAPGPALNAAACGARYSDRVLLLLWRRCWMLLVLGAVAQGQARQSKAAGAFVMVRRYKPQPGEGARYGLSHGAAGAQRLAGR